VLAVAPKAIKAREKPSTKVAACRKVISRVEAVLSVLVA
jgi:hypothetical protein